MLPIPKYKLPPNPPNENLNRLPGVKMQEVFTGVVRGQDASKYEERAARSLDKIKDRIEGYDFQYSGKTKFNLPGEENQIDFVVWLFVGAQPIEIDGDWVHRTASDKAKVALRDELINDVASAWGWLPVIRIKGHEIETQEDCDAVFNEIFP